jgi:hypothetical protein
MSATKARTIAWTGGVAATTAFGAWYGASLKTQKDIEKVRHSILCHNECHQY